MRKIKTNTAIIGAGIAGLKAYEQLKKSVKNVIVIDPKFSFPEVFRSGYLPMEILRSYTQDEYTAKNDELPVTMYGFDRSKRMKFTNVLQDLRERHSMCAPKCMKDYPSVLDTDRLVGHASFQSPHELYVEEVDTLVEAERIVIATGSEPYIPYDLQDAGARVISNQEFFELKSLPKSVAIVGAGSTALELGQALTRLGVQVIIFWQKNFWHYTDEKVAEYALKGLRFHTLISMQTEITEIREEADGVTLYYMDSSLKECYLRVEYIISALGRVPNVSHLKIENAGLPRDSSGIISTDQETGQTVVPHIFAAGSVTTRHTTLQKTIHDGVIVGINAGIYPNPLKKYPWIPLLVSFTSPGMAVVGRTEAMMLENHGLVPCVTGECTVKDCIWSELHQDSTGIVHLYFEVESQKLVGAELCLQEAAYVAQFLAFAIFEGKTLAELKHFSFFHPSPLETIQKAIEDAAQKIVEYTLPIA